MSFTLKPKKNSEKFLRLTQEPSDGWESTLPTAADSRPLVSSMLRIVPKDLPLLFRHRCLRLPLHRNPTRQSRQTRTANRREGHRSCAAPKLRGATADDEGSRFLFSFFLFFLTLSNQSPATPVLRQDFNYAPPPLQRALVNDVPHSVLRQARPLITSPPSNNTLVSRARGRGLAVALLHTCALTCTHTHTPGPV